MSDGDEDSDASPTIQEEMEKIQKERIRKEKEAVPSSTSSSDDDEEDDPLAKKLPALSGKTSSPLVGTQDLSQSQGFPYHLAQPSQLSQAPPAFASVSRAPINVGLIPIPMQQAVHRTLTPLESYQVDPWPPYMCAGQGQPYYYDNGKGRPPLPHNKRSASAPVSRAPSPAASSAKKKKKNVNRHGRTKEEEDKFQSLVDTVVKRFTKDKKDLITCLEEQDGKKADDREFHRVAKWITVNRGKENETKIDLAELKCAQIRRLAGNCGIRRGGQMNLFDARRHIALWIDTGTVYNDNSLTGNPSSNWLPIDRRIFTYMRVLNAVFHKTMIATFITINDTKKRKEYESAHGGNPVKTSGIVYQRW
ncbi:hypothetical protein SEMRO_100_G051190.1 [Seminavis robusta]|uniref:Uncharacterized protein n=1 Tax=Seminavis robusta TaxID=568900 RepID=A0A9N8DEC1_9STRA|nr:hypothetical protein SEMRO_100_G051190.1 [Seminavis robusta]|eukprot:Sro100_g051190.1 n/a (363) ;mRNA; f:36599-37687